MRSKLFIILSTIALLGVSVVAFSEVTMDSWVWYGFDVNDKPISRPLGQIPHGDCLETICEYGCVENDAGNGYCCPGNGQCRVGEKDVDLCCAEDEFCEDGSCVKKTCTFNGSLYEHNATVGECGKCVNGSVVQDMTKTLPECKSSCNTTTWRWNNLVDNTKVDDCHVCMNGQNVNAADGTKVSNCQECRDGLKVNMPDDTIIGECGKCYNGIVIQDINKPDPDCQKCDTESGSSTQWQWVSNPVTNDQEIQDSCHKCSNGAVVLKDTNKTIVCNTQCCITGQVCLDNQRCGCPEETPVWDEIQQKCVECVTDKDCKGEQICYPDKTCGCPEGMTKYIKGEGTGGCCNDQSDTATHVLASITGTTNQACCPKETPVWDIEGQQCVECLTDTDCEGDDKYCAEDHTCQNLAGKECFSQADCGGFNSGYFCKISSWKRMSDSRSEKNCYSDLKGKCVWVDPAANFPSTYKLGTGLMWCHRNPSKAGTKFVEGVGTLTLSIQSMNWWSASNFCEAIGKKLINVSKFQIYKSGTSDLISNGVSNCNSNGFCAKSQECDGRTDYKSSNFSPQASAVFHAFGDGWWVWTSSSVGNTSKNSCYSVELRGTGEVYHPGSRRTTHYGRYVIERKKEASFGSPLCIDE